MHSSQCVSNNMIRNTARIRFPSLGAFSQVWTSLHCWYAIQRSFWRRRMYNEHDSQLITTYSPPSLSMRGPRIQYSSIHENVHAIHHHTKNVLVIRESFLSGSKRSNWAVWPSSIECASAQHIVVQFRTLHMDIRVVVKLWAELWYIPYTVVVHNVN